MTSSWTSFLLLQWSSLNLTMVNAIHLNNQPSSGSCFVLLRCIGVGGVEGDGDIMRADNLTAFQTFVLSQTDQKGVHFVMGDGVRVDIGLLC